MHEGDIVILGSSADVITLASPAGASQILIKNKPDAFRVTVCTDNSSSSQGHYRLGG
jgi:hemolysin activation/secretion protein